jgi:thioredoxin 1
MKGSKRLALIVILIVVAVVIAKQVRRSPKSPEPVAVAQAPAGGSSGQVAPAAAQPAKAETRQPEQSAPAAAKTPQKPASTPGPQAAASKPSKPEGPLPGSKLEECLRSGRPTMADFGLGTCKPCKAMEPILKQAAQDYWGRANILFVELDKYPDLAREYRIMLMPTQIFFDASGNQVDSHMGYMDREEIDRQVAALGVKR